MNILFFKKPKLKRILEQYNKFIDSEAVRKLKEAEDMLIQMFMKEAQNCKHFEERVDHPFEQFCMHPKGTGPCDIWVCPRRK